MSMMSMLGKMAMGIVVAKVAKGAMGGGSGGGLGDMLGGLLGGNKTASSASQGGGLSDLLSGLTGGSSNSGSNSKSDLGGLLSAALSGGTVEATPSQEEQAKTLLKAMINAAKADGHIDQDEQAKIVEHIGEVTPEELEFVKSEMASELDIEGVIAGAKGIEAEVYLSSLTTINLDSKEEALYLDKLAKGLGLSEEAVDTFHEKLGVAKLYS